MCKSGCVYVAYAKIGSPDVAISHNEWPVRFLVRGEKTELVTRFTLFFWVRYISLMKTQPLPQSAITEGAEVCFGAS